MAVLGAVQRLEGFRQRRRRDRGEASAPPRCAGCKNECGWDETLSAEAQISID
jgi:hypothetical protein